MSATTIKLEADLIRKVTSLKSKEESISGFVRALIEREHRVRENRAAAVEYQQFLQESPQERAAMENWEFAPLANEIEPEKP